MASKLDAARARANFWVMQQNMAKQKGGGGWMPRPRPAPAKTLAPKNRVTAPASLEGPSAAESPDAIAAPHVTDRASR